MRVSPSSLGKGLGTPNPKTAPVKPKSLPGRSELGTRGRRPEPHPRSPSRVQDAQTTATAATEAQIRPSPPPNPASGTAPTEDPAESNHPRTCSSP